VQEGYGGKGCSEDVKVILNKEADIISNVK
jgi:hypothetical protein